MINQSDIREHMEVLDSAGIHVGTVDHLDGDRIKLTRNDSTDHDHHYIPLTSVARIDRHVHLLVTRASALGTAGAGLDHAAGRNRYLPWILLAAGIVLLFLLLRSCGDREQTAVVAPAPAEQASPAAAALPVQAVALPNGQSVDAAPGTLNFELQRYLASAEAAPRTFTFDQLNFDTGLASIRPTDTGTVAALATILSAYPQARVRLVGYADAQGAAGANADLGKRRATAVSEALVARNVAANRVETASGGEANPVDSNATEPGRFENRRTELVVLAK